MISNKQEIFTYLFLFSSVWNHERSCVWHLVDLHHVTIANVIVRKDLKVRSYWTWPMVRTDRNRQSNVCVMHGKTLNDHHDNTDFVKGPNWRESIVFCVLYVRYDKITHCRNAQKCIKSAETLHLLAKRMRMTIFCNEVNIVSHTMRTTNVTCSPLKESVISSEFCLAIVIETSNMTLVYATARMRQMIIWNDGIIFRHCNCRNRLNCMKCDA